MSDSCNPMDCSPLGSSVHGISQARILEWVAIPFSRESSQPRDQTHISCIAGGVFTAECRVSTQYMGAENRNYLQDLFCPLHPFSHHHHHQYPPGQTQLSFQRHVGSGGFPFPWAPDPQFGSELTQGRQHCSPHVRAWLGGPSVALVVGTKQ